MTFGTPRVLARSIDGLHPRLLGAVGPIPLVSRDDSVSLRESAVQSERYLDRAPPLRHRCLS